MRKNLQNSIHLNSENDTKTIFDKLYFYFFLFIPIVYFPILVDPVLASRQFYLSFFLIIINLIYISKARKNEVQLKLNSSQIVFSILYILFITSLIISIIQAQVISESLNTIVRQLTIFGFFITTSLLFKTSQLNLQHIIKGIKYMLLISLTFSVFQFFTLDLVNNDFGKAVYAIYSTNGHKNLLSSYLLISTLILFLNDKKHKNFGFKTLIIFTLLLIIILQTRAVWLAGIIIFIIYLIMKSSSKSSSNKINPLVIFSAIVFILLTIGLLGKTNFFSHLLYSESVEERMDLWENSLLIIKNHFWTGIGAGNWQFKYTKFGLTHFDQGNVTSGWTTFQRPHNDFLWIFSEGGFFSGVLYFSLLGSSILYSIKNYILSIEKVDKQKYLILFCIIIVFFIISLFDFPFERIEHMLLISLIWAIIFSSNLNLKNEAVLKKNISINILPITLLIISLFTLFVSFKRMSGEFHTQKMYGYRQMANWQNVIEEAEQAKNDFYQVDPTSIPLDWYKGVAYFSMNQKDKAKKSFESAFKLSPYNIHVINNLASVNEVTGKHKKAIEYYRLALKISPNFEESLLNLAAVYYNEKKYENAYETINKCSSKSKDQKYLTFLPPILEAFSKTKKGQSTFNFNFNNKEDLTQKYLNSKKE